MKRKPFLKIEFLELNPLMRDHCERIKVHFTDIKTFIKHYDWIKKESNTTIDKYTDIISTLSEPKETWGEKDKIYKCFTKELADLYVDNLLKVVRAMSETINNIGRDLESLKKDCSSVIKFEFTLQMRNSEVFYSFLDEFNDDFINEKEGYTFKTELKPVMDKLFDLK